MDTKGANTFPLYNLPPELKIFQKRSFSVLLYLSLLDKIKVGGDSSLPQHVLRQKQKVSSPTVLHSGLSFVPRRMSLLPRNGILPPYLVLMIEFCLFSGILILFY